MATETRKLIEFRIWFKRTYGFNWIENGNELCTNAWRAWCAAWDMALRVSAAGIE